MQYADPVADLLDKSSVFRSRLFRESCVFHRGNYIKVFYNPHFQTAQGGCEVIAALQSSRMSESVENCQG